MLLSSTTGILRISETFGNSALILRNSAGSLVTENDDYGGLDSQLNYVPTTSGVYYIDVGAWADPQNPSASYPGVTGDYELSVTAFQTPPVCDARQTSPPSNNYALVSTTAAAWFFAACLIKRRTVSVGCAPLPIQY